MNPKYEIKNASGSSPKGKINYAEQLNREQLEVVTSTPGPKLVLAGAGSGKTRTLTYRVAYLIEQGFNPRQILLMTFTNKAAAEMLDRVSQLLDGMPKGVRGGTFHHIGNSILRKYAKLVGYTSEFLIMDTEDSKTLMRTVISSLGIDVKATRFPKADLLVSIYSYARNTQISIEDTLLRKYPHYIQLLPQIELVFKNYQDRKVALNAMDFDDLLVNWLRLLKENVEVRQKLGNQYQHILVDEYQDTNVLQADIIDLMAEQHHNVLVVGDDAQSIYSFRGANFRNIMDFKKRYPEAIIYYLLTNYRSTPEILTLANGSIVHNQEQYKKELHPIKETGTLPALIPLKNVEEQAEFIAQRVLELRDEGISLSEIGVLYRSHYHSLELQVELTRRNIPYQIRSGLRFFEQAHIKDVMGYLRIAYNPKDELSWRRVLELYPGIGKGTVQKLWLKISMTTDVFNLIFDVEFLNQVPRRARNSWQQFTNLLGMLVSEGIYDNPSEQVRQVIGDFYENYARENFENYQDRLTDLEQLALFALNYDSSGDFLSEVTLQEGVKGETVVDTDPDTEDHLVLSTIHRAKGLEWTVVFLMQCAEYFFPSARSFGENEAIEEERRLFYVASTRAKNELYLTYPLMAQRWDGMVICKPSQFVRELPLGCFEQWEVEHYEEEW